MTETIDNIHEMPVGIYFGKWSGYFVIVTVENYNYSLQTRDGVRGINIPVKVTATKDKILLEI
jgi:hypothetical protein